MHTIAPAGCSLAALNFEHFGSRGVRLYYESEDSMIRETCWDGIHDKYRNDASPYLGGYRLPISMGRFVSGIAWKEDDLDMRLYLGGTDCIFEHRYTGGWPNWFTRLLNLSPECQISVLRGDSGVIHIYFVERESLVEVQRSHQSMLRTPILSKLVCSGPECPGSLGREVPQTLDSDVISQFPSLSAVTEVDEIQADVFEVVGKEVGTQESEGQELQSSVDVRSDKSYTDTFPETSNLATSSKLSSIITNPGDYGFSTNGDPKDDPGSIRTGAAGGDSYLQDTYSEVSGADTKDDEQKESGQAKDAEVADLASASTSPSLTYHQEPHIAGPTPEKDLSRPSEPATTVCSSTNINSDTFSGSSTAISESRSDSRDTDPTSYTLSNDGDPKGLPVRPLTSAAEDSDLQETATLYSEVSGPATEIISGYVSKFVDGVLEELRQAMLGRESFYRFSRIEDVLPGLLKDFAIRFGHDSQSQVRRDIVFFTHRHSR